MELKKKEFLTRLTEPGYLRDLVETILTEVRFESRTVVLQDKPKTSKKILLFVTTFNLATPILKKDSNKTLAPNYRQKTLAQIYPNAANVAYRKEKICNRFSC